MTDTGVTTALDQSSATVEMTPAPAFSVQGTMTIEERARDLAERAGHIRNTTTIVGDDAASVHHDAFHIQLDTRTSQLVKTDPVVLLDQLSDLGFAWRDIARMVGVSVPALRHWRAGDRPTGENRRSVAQLLAFSQIIRDDHLVFEPASWMEVRISRGAPTTGIDLYAAGNLDILYDLAAEHCSPEEALDAYEPGWREKHRSDWEVAMAEDRHRTSDRRRVGEPRHLRQTR